MYLAVHDTTGVPTQPVPRQLVMYTLYSIINNLLYNRLFVYCINCLADVTVCVSKYTERKLKNCTSIYMYMYM